MITSILATKGKMSQSFIEGRRVPVTKIFAGPCVVTQLKSPEKDGYWAVQLGLGEKRIKNITKPMQGHLRPVLTGQASKTGRGVASRFIKEIRLDEESNLNVGDEIKAFDIFSSGDYISVTGISKGKGFAGGVKRWHFAGGPRTHGQSDRERAPGSIGATTTPGRVLKGKHMAGRMGGDRVYIKNLQIVSVDPNLNEIKVSGPVPGVPGGLLYIQKIAEGKLKGISQAVSQVVEGEGVAEPSQSTSQEDKIPEVKEGVNA
jgi:large subunit ribosomal protein L3